MSINSLALPTTIRQAGRELREGKYTAAALAEAYLDHISQVEPDIHALLTIAKDEALTQARVADERLRAGDESALLGIPLIHKDNFCTLDVATTAGSHILENYKAQYDATTVAKLKQAGAVMLGKANLDAFAHGSSTENSDFGPITTRTKIKIGPKSILNHLSFICRRQLRVPIGLLLILVTPIK